MKSKDDRALVILRAGCSGVGFCRTVNVGKTRGNFTSWNQMLRRGANITRPGSSSDLGHARAKMSVLLHAGYGRESVRARCCAGWQHSSCDARAHAGSTRTAAAHRVAPCIGAPAREMCCGPRSARAPAALRRLWRASMWGSMVRVLRFTGSGHRFDFGMRVTALGRNGGKEGGKT